jgi:hypothetical protein
MNGQRGYNAIYQVSWILFRNEGQKQTLAFSPHLTHFVTPTFSARSPEGCSNGIHKLLAPIDGARESSGASSSTRPLLFSLTSSSHSSLSPINISAKIAQLKPILLVLTMRHENNALRIQRWNNFLPIGDKFDVIIQ